jgi:hypothetical protein
MIKTLSNAECVRELLNDMDADWTRTGAEALVEWLEMHESETELMEFDPVALRCDWSEYETYLEAATAHGWVFDADDTADEQEERARVWLMHQTAVIEHHAGIVIQEF